MQLFAKDLDVKQCYKLLTGSIIPRPIGFISTINKTGITNAAPYSFFNAVCSAPPTIMISMGFRPDGTLKDTHANIEKTGEFVVNIVSLPILEKMNMTAIAYAPEISEFTEAGLTPVPSNLVLPPRIGESLISMECKVTHTIPLGIRPTGTTVIFGEVLVFHLDDSIFDKESGYIHTEKLDAVGRLAGNFYTTVHDVIEVVRKG